MDSVSKGSLGGKKIEGQLNAMEELYSQSVRICHYSRERNKMTGDPCHKQLNLFVFTTGEELV